MSLAGAAPYGVPAGFAGGFPPWKSLPWEVTCFLDNYLRALSLFSTSFPNPGPQDVPTELVESSFSYKVRTMATPTDVVLSVLLPWILSQCCHFLKAHLLKPGIKPVYSLGFLWWKLAYGMLMIQWELEWVLVQDPELGLSLGRGKIKRRLTELCATIVCWFESLARNVFKAANGNSHLF